MDIEQIIEPERILLKIHIKGLSIEAHIVASIDSTLDTSYPQKQLLPTQINASFFICNGDEKLSYEYSTCIVENRITLANVIDACKSSLQYLAKHLPDAMEQFFSQMLVEGLYTPFENVLVTNLPEKAQKKRAFSYLKKLEKVSEVNQKKRLGLPTKAGRPYGGFKFARVEDFLKKLLSVAKELKTENSNITINSLCRFIRPTPIDLKTFKATCERFGLDQDKLLVLLKSESLLNTKTLLKLAKKEDTKTKISELILEN